MAVKRKTAAKKKPARKTAKKTTTSKKNIFAVAARSIKYKKAKAKAVKAAKEASAVYKFVVKAEMKKRKK